jgi:hypothetical protein
VNAVPFPVNEGGQAGHVCCRLLTTPRPLIAGAPSTDTASRVTRIESWYIMFKAKGEGWGMRTTGELLIYSRVRVRCRLRVQIVH